MDSGEIALVFEMGADSVDIGETIRPRPTLGERNGTTLQEPRLGNHSLADLTLVRMNNCHLLRR